MVSEAFIGGGGAHFLVGQVLEREALWGINTEGLDNMEDDIGQYSTRAI